LHTSAIQGLKAAMDDSEVLYSQVSRLRNGSQEACAAPSGPNSAAMPCVASMQKAMCCSTSTPNFEGQSNFP
jgi:hypothetical protein